MKLFFSLLCAVVIGATSCVVSDEIEFHERINMPPLLVSTEPSENYISTIEVRNERMEFTVTVWDPDKDDGALYEGYVWVIEQSNPDPDNSVCGSPEYTEPDPKQFKGGVMVTLTCSPDFYFGATEVTSVIVQIEVSDRGFITPDQVPDGANRLQEKWTVEVFPNSFN